MDARHHAILLCLVVACESPPVDVGETLDASASAAEMGDGTDAMSTSAGEETSVTPPDASDDGVDGGSTATSGPGGAVPCDPIAQDCPDLQGCYVVDDEFGCHPDESGDMDLPGTPCDAPNACAPTMICIDCGGADCCVRLCSTPEPECAEGETCTPYFPIDEAPPGLENVGVCT